MEAFQSRIKIPNKQKFTWPASTKTVVIGQEMLR